MLGSDGGNFFFGEIRPPNFWHPNAVGAASRKGCDGWLRPIYLRHEVDLRLSALRASRRLVRGLTPYFSRFGGKLPGNPSEMPPVFLTAEWRSLVMINYAVEPAVLAPHVPRGVELDLWEGEALVSMVGFQFLRTRVLGFPIPFHQNFDEVNLRFYVRRRIPDGWRRGVVFVREIVPRFAIAAVARVAYNEPYLSLPMRHCVPSPLETGARLEFGWRFRGRWHSLAAALAGEPGDIPEGSAEEFIFEHYYGYTRQRDGGTVEYQVEHPRWRAWQTSESFLDADIAALYGVPFSASLREKARSAFVAEGSPVLVRRGVRVAPIQPGS